MIFTTHIPLKKQYSTIDYNCKIVSIGSCFADNMAAKFNYYKFKNTANPTGVLFNPVAIENLFFRAYTDKKFTENDLFFHDGLFKCFEVHSDLNSDNKEHYLSNLNQIINDFKIQISEANYIIITLGTAWVYQHKESGKIVANCHKVSQNQFNKIILSTEMIESSIQNTVELILKNNPDCQIIITVSPVRHLKDGFTGNTQSKAHLFAAVHKILQNNAQNVNYFPSYEIMMDELRDYRFYEQDLIHPNKIAIDYIWERFCATFLSNDAIDIAQQIEALQKDFLHRPTNQNSVSHLKFTSKLKQKLAIFLQNHPNITF